MNSLCRRCKLMKKIFYLLAVLASLLMFFTGSALAKEYRIDKAKASFDIPNGYLVATRDNIPDSVIQNTGLTKQQLLEYFNQTENNSTTVLIAYHKDHTLFFHVAEDAGAKKIVDYLKMPEENFTDSRVLELLRKKIQDETHWNINSVVYQKIGDARYHVAEGFFEENNNKYYAKYYVTIKNSVSVGLTAISAIPNNTTLNKDLDYILKNTKYDNENSKNVNAVTTVKKQSEQSKSVQQNKSKNSPADTSGSTIYIVLLIAIAIVEQYCCLKQAAIRRISQLLNWGIDLRTLIIPIWFNITWITPIIQIFLLTKIFPNYPWYYCLGMYILYFAVCSIFLPVPRSMYINSIEKLRNIIDDPAWRKKAELNGIDSDTIFVLSSDLYDLQFKMDQAKK